MFSLSPFFSNFMILLSLVHPAWSIRLVRRFSRNGSLMRLKASSLGSTLGPFFEGLLHAKPFSSTSNSKSLVSYLSIEVTGSGLTSGLLGRGGGRGGRGGGGGGGPPNKSPLSPSESERWKFVLGSSCSVGGSIWFT